MNNKKQLKNKKPKQNKQDIESYIYEHEGWNEKIDHAVDIIHFNFKNFGWEWGLEKKTPSREEIYCAIVSLIEDAKAYGSQVESGRIAVQIVDEDLWIALSFF